MTDKEKPEVTTKMLEEIAAEVFAGQLMYPRYCGNGVYEICKGVYGNEKALEQVNNAISNYIKPKIEKTIIKTPFGKIEVKDGEDEDICINSGPDN